MKRFLALLLALTLVVGVAPMAMAMAQVEPRRIVFQMNEEPRRMDPTMNDYSSGSYGLQSLFRGLYKFAEDGTFAPAMAESYDVSEDGTVYTFHLRKDLKWSDGSPLTAYDFEYSWLRVLNPDLASETAYSMYNVFKNAYAYYVNKTAAVEDVGIKALDELTLQATLNAPTPYFISMTATTAFYPVKKEVVEQYGQDWEWNDKVYVSNGPFRMKEMRRDEKFIYEKNPYYYDAENVQVDELEIVFLTASETALLAFENKDVDIITSVSPDALAKYMGTDTLMLTERIGYRWYEFRCDREPFNDPRVRRALAMALDRKVLIDAVLQSPETPLRGFIPKAFPDTLDPSQSWRETHPDTFSEDLDAAKALLAEAGFPNGEGFPSFRLVQTPDATLVKVAQAMAQMWKQNLGINAEIVTVETGVYWADDTGTRKAGDFEVCYMGYTGDFLDPFSILSPLMSAENEAIQWGNKEYDELMYTISTGITGEERQAAFEKAEEILAAEMPVIPIYNYVATALVSDKVGGFIRSYGGTPNFEYAYIK